MPADGGGRDVIGVLELVDALLETGDVLAQELCSCLALAVVVFAAVVLLCARALLTGGLGAVTSLDGRSAGIWCGGKNGDGTTHHFPFPERERAGGQWGWEVNSVSVLMERRLEDD